MMKNDFMSENMEDLKNRLENCKKKSDKTERDLGKLHAEAEVSHPLMIDEVSASFISFLRVQSWESLGDEYGGYKIGRILAYILDVLNEQIEDSTAATIKVDVPLYEQCPKVACNCGGECELGNNKIEKEKNQYKCCLEVIQNSLRNELIRRGNPSKQFLYDIYELTKNGLKEEVEECE